MSILPWGCKKWRRGTGKEIVRGWHWMKKERPEDFLTLQRKAKQSSFGFNNSRKSTNPDTLFLKLVQFIVFVSLRLKMLTCPWDIFFWKWRINFKKKKKLGLKWLFWIFLCELWFSWLIDLFTLSFNFRQYIKKMT